MKAWLFILVLFFARLVVAQSYFNTSLIHGPHRVGFKAGVHYDLGRPAIREQFSAFRKGRAVHISVWYPAVVKANHQTMLFSEYVDEISRTVNPMQVSKKTRTRSVEQMNTILAQFGGDSILLKKHLPLMLSSSTKAFRNAASRSGEYPVIIYPESAYLNSILCEYLASYGYIVVSVSRHGTQDAEFEWQSIRGIETLVQDCQFALSIIRKEFNPGSGVAVMGTGMNASAGLAWMMRNPAISALVSLEGGILTGYEYGLIQQSPYFNAAAVTRPMLVIHSPHMAVDPVLIRRYKYADRFMINLPGMREFYYLNFGVWEKSIPGILGAAPGDTKTSFEWMARYALFFLDWQLKNGYEGKTFFSETPEQHGVPSGLMTFSVLPRQDVPPTHAELLTIKDEDGFHAMLREVKKFQREDSLVFSVETYASIGQSLIAEKAFREGTEWAESFRTIFPNAVIAHTLAGRCLLELGSKQEATAMYTMALRLLPADLYVPPAEKEKLKSAIEQRLQQLTQ